MEVYGIKRDPADCDGRPDADRVLPAEEFHEVLPETDLLVATVSLTEETRGSIGADVLRALPETVSS